MADEEIVRSYARDVLGMKDDEMDEYLWLAEESMRAPMPPGWEQFEDEARGKPYYVNATTGVTQWDHPSDEQRRTTGVVVCPNRALEFAKHRSCRSW